MCTPIKEDILVNNGLHRVDASFPFDCCPLYEPANKSFSLCQLEDSKWLLWINDENGMLITTIEDIDIFYMEDLEDKLKEYNRDYKFIYNKREY